MPNNDKKMSEILKEMSERLLRSPDATHSPEAASLALMFAHFAWNETVGLDFPRQNYRPTWQSIEAENPAVWNEFKSTNIDGMIDELIEYKKQHFPDDQRRIVTCGLIDSKIKVNWLLPAAPGVDSKAEMRVYGLVMTGRREEAKQFLQETQQMSPREAAKAVKKVARTLGLR